MKIQMRMPMKLKMQTYIAGSEYALQPGDVTDRFPDAEAQRLIDRGYAVLVVNDGIERAVKPDVAETRAPRRGKRG